MITNVLPPFYGSQCIVDVHTYKNILLPRYGVPQKTANFGVVVPKTEDSATSATICAHRNAIIFCTRIIVIF